MSEEPTEVVRTVAAVSVHPAATPQETERLERVVVHCERTAETLREISVRATAAKEALCKVDVSQPPNANDARVAQAIAKLTEVVRMANAAGKANDAIMGSEKGRKGV
jgi:hypothetical protein